MTAPGPLTSVKHGLSLGLGCGWRERCGGDEHELDDERVRIGLGGQLLEAERREVGALGMVGAVQQPAGGLGQVERGHQPGGAADSRRLDDLDDHAHAAIGRDRPLAAVGGEADRGRGDQDGGAGGGEGLVDPRGRIALVDYDDGATGEGGVALEDRLGLGLHGGDDHSTLSGSLMAGPGCEAAGSSAASPVGSTAKLPAATSCSSRVAASRAAARAPLGSSSVPAARIE